MPSGTAQARGLLMVLLERLQCGDCAPRRKRRSSCPAYHVVARALSSDPESAMSDAARRAGAPMTVAAFLHFCDVVPDGEKWELHDSRPVMMVGGTAAHAMIAGNILRALFEPARRRGCRPMSGF